MKFSKRFALTFIALIGLITSVKLSIIYMDANFNPDALSSFCSINQFIDCDGVAQTTHSQFLGVPLAFWGLFLYFVFLFFTYTDKLYNIKIGRFRDDIYCINLVDNVTIFIDTLKLGARLLFSK